MSDADIRALLELVLDAALEKSMRVLIGILKTETRSVLSSVAAMRDLLEHPAAVGITVCPPAGSGRSQSEIADGLSEVLGLGIPTALYQLPQVTGNEMSPETVAALAANFGNFILFKDTSGTDRVASSGVDLGGVFMVRGSEKGGYARWTRDAGGPYDGFLLSTGNVFGRELKQILELLRTGDKTRAKQLSSKLESIVSEVFALVENLGFGNAFTNTNKLLDHLQAHGSAAHQVPPPMLYSGVRLPADALEQTRVVLSRHGRLPGTGYLAAPKN